MQRGMASSLNGSADLCCDFLRASTDSPSPVRPVFFFFFVFCLLQGEAQNRSFWRVRNADSHVGLAVVFYRRKRSVKEMMMAFLNSLLFIVVEVTR